jgi:hypothetical protein
MESVVLLATTGDVSVLNPTWYADQSEGLPSVRWTYNHSRNASHCSRRRPGRPWSAICASTARARASSRPKTQRHMTPTISTGLHARGVADKE